jgi:hypothetical protein
MESGAVARVRAIWAALFKLPPDLLDQPGTTLIAADGRALDAWITPWPVGERVVIEVPPTLLDEARALLAARPAGHRLTAADFKEAWGADNLVSGAMRILVQDGSVFRPAVPEARYHARQLTAAINPRSTPFSRAALRTRSKRGRSLWNMRWLMVSSMARAWWPGRVRIYGADWWTLAC